MKLSVFGAALTTLLLFAAGTARAGVACSPGGKNNYPASCPDPPPGALKPFDANGKFDDTRARPHRTPALPHSRG